MRRVVQSVAAMTAMLVLPAAAREILQECRLVEDMSSLPVAIRSAVEKQRPAAVRVCKQVDFSTETYHAVGPVELLDDVCQFTYTSLPPEQQSAAPYELRFMLPANGECPAPDPTRYIPAHNVSAEDFAAIAKLLRHMSSSKEGLAEALGELSDEQQQMPGLRAFQQQVQKTGRISVIRIVHPTSLFGLRSMFEIEIEGLVDKSQFYVLQVRKRLFGGLKVVGLERGNI